MNRRGALVGYEDSGLPAEMNRSPVKDPAANDGWDQQRTEKCSERHVGYMVRHMGQNELVSLRILDIVHLTKVVYVE